MDPPAMSINKLEMDGTEAKQVAATAVKTRHNPAKAKASGSFLMLTVPRARPADPIPSPRETESLTPHAFKVLTPIIPPKIPVKMMQVAAMARLPPSISAMIIPKAV
mmetsp:Transcript_83012/g.240174  ORF Transcript_83012/g.240174 Transcript_83012/m.240174 type:complete len:107 (+) Transcript_83012:203-523(+)